MQFSTGNFPIDLCIFFGGLIALIKGSDWFVESAATVARHFSIPDIVIGLTLVSIGTSLPELGTNLYAAVNNQGSIALGNVLGSNVTNIALVLGIAVVCMGRIDIAKRVFNRDIMIMLASYAAFLIFAAFKGSPENVLSRLEGAIMFAAFIAYIVYLFRSPKDPELAGAMEHEENTSFNSWSTAAFLLLGLLGVFLGAKMIVDPVIKTAQTYGMPNALISATVVAFGTSVPELAVTISGIVKKKHDIAVGNIVGSCTFNLLLVMSASMMVNPISVDPTGMTLGLIMCAVGIVFAICVRTKWALVRWEGIVFLLMYAGFIAYNINGMTATKVAAETTESRSIATESQPLSDAETPSGQTQE